jgi:hypothetical protein
VNNCAAVSGAGLSLYGTVDLIESTVSNNKALSVGGALTFQGGGTTGIAVSDTLLLANSVTNGNGGGMVRAQIKP